MSRIIVSASPNAPRPDDPLVREIADVLMRIEINYEREGTGARLTVRWPDAPRRAGRDCRRPGPGRATAGRHVIGLHWVRLMHGKRRGVALGRRKETAVWIANKPQRKVLWRDHDSLYVAVGRLRLRIVKPWVRAR